MRRTNRDALEMLPLTPAIFHILLTLSDGEKHGYAIMREVENRSAGGLRIGPGTLYRSVQKMLDDGLIEESEDRPHPDVADERRRYYRMTDFGRAVAVAEAQRLAGVVREAQLKKLLPKPRTT
jgi:DNA-binding PadR family transcriptional regulator